MTVYLFNVHFNYAVAPSNSKQSVNVNLLTYTNDLAVIYLLQSAYLMGVTSSQCVCVCNNICRGVCVCVCVCVEVGTNFKTQQHLLAQRILPSVNITMCFHGDHPHIIL